MDADELAARNSIGARIKAERLRLGLTPEQFATRAAVSRATVFNWESGVRMPDALAIQRMHRAVGIDALLVLTGQRSQPTSLPRWAQDTVTRYVDLPPRLRSVVDEVALVSWLAFDARREMDYGQAMSSDPGAAAGMTVHEPAPKFRKAPPR